MPIQTTDNEWLHQFPFRITREKYLGIIIAKNYNSLFKVNFDPLMDTLQNNIQFWRTLPISLLGRTNADIPLAAVISPTEHTCLYLIFQMFRFHYSFSCAGL